MFYIRDNISGQVLAGIGSVSRRFKNISMVWRSWRERHWAKRFDSPEAAQRYIDHYMLCDVSIVDEAERVIEIQEGA